MTKRFPTRQKIVWGFGQLLRYVKWYITTSPFLQTGQKDDLIRSLTTIHQQLEDAEQRSRGEIPPTPAAQKQWKDQVKQSKKRNARESIKEERLVDELVRDVLLLKAASPK